MNERTSDRMKVIDLNFIEEQLQILRKQSNPVAAEMNRIESEQLIQNLAKLKAAVGIDLVIMLCF